MLIGLAWLTMLVLGGGLNAYGQSVQSEPWLDELGPVPEYFTNAYVRGRYAAAAATLLEEDPFSVNAVTLLMGAGREDEAMALVERIGQSRPGLLVSAFEKLRFGGGPYAPPWDPKAEAWTARLKALSDQVGRAPKPSATEPGRSNNTAVARPGQDDELARALLNARQQFARARDSLGKRHDLSDRDVATTMTPSLRLLRQLAERDRGRYGRQALALLAHGEFEAGQLREASGDYTLLEQRYQDSEGAWPAAMRQAQLTQSLGDPDAAAKIFARLAKVHAGKPAVTALASFYEARAYEATARWTDALRAYRTAFNAWPANDSDWMGLEWKVLYFTDQFVESLWPQYISRSDVAQRIEVLTQVVAVPSAGEMEWATWLLDHRRPSEARELLLRATEPLHGAIPPPSLLSLLHRAEVNQAVSAISRQGRLPPKAAGALKQLCSEPFDAWAGIGCAIHASVLSVDGQAKAAEAALRQTFSKWVEAQGGAMKPSTPENEMARDAMAIRDLLFEPDGVYGLRGESKSYTPPSFIFIPSVLRVTTGLGAQSHDIEADTVQGRSNLILLSALQTRTLWAAVEQLSACDNGRRSQRLNRSWYAIVGFWRVFCTADSLYTAPTVGPIHFMNLERTRAQAVMTVGMHTDGGRVAVVEKVDGEWKVTGSAGSWNY
jgi:tetratricopeptide (TPR) repeat protein